MGYKEASIIRLFASIYIWMHTRCFENGLVVHRDVVRKLMKTLDPVGVFARVKRTLRRRCYSTKGPNWHIKSYNKRNPYGICVIGCIDMYSGYIIFLTVGSIDNNPTIIARYYVEILTSLKRITCSIRSDMRTENMIIAAMRSLLRRNAWS